jgi:hypothetical protein
VEWVKLDILANILSMLILVYAVFPISQVRRLARDSFASSKSGTIDFIFKDLAIANIKVFVHVVALVALVALFGAFAMILSRFAPISISGDFNTEWIAKIDYDYSLSMTANAQLASALHLVFSGNILANDTTN